MERAGQAAAARRGGERGFGVVAPVGREPWGFQPLRGDYTKEGDPRVKGKGMIE
jgi:hypothetical protein